MDKNTQKVNYNNKELGQSKTIAWYQVSNWNAFNTLFDMLIQY